MREIRYDNIHETLYTDRLENGLTVYLLAKPGFQQTFATFTTHYGSTDSTFRLAGEPNFVTVPDGIAHFLEHKMFASEGGDVFPQFAKHGASANAFTTFDTTSYLFSGTEDLYENTKTLLDFVQDPYFTDDSVEKEKGIIGQEIQMYDDNPDWRAFFNLLRGMYNNHPVRIDIAGTVESIAKITKETLYQCYNTFYHPSNMVYFAVGGFDVDKMMTFIRENQAKKSFANVPPIERSGPQEPAGVAQENTVVHLSVSQPRCLIGWKDARVGLTGRALLEQELLTGVILDALFGRSSELYHALIDQELVDQQFSWEYECTPTYGYSVVGGNTTNPDKLLAGITSALKDVIDQGIPPEDFERCRKKAIGRFMAALDSPSYIARNYTAYYFKEADMFESVDVLEKMTVQQANERASAHFLATQQAVSTVLPKQ